MSLEQAIRDVIGQKMADGTVEKLITENLEAGINKALGNLFANYGDMTKLVEAKIKSVMVGQLEGFDYSKYVVKLDAVLTEILKNTALDHAKILENFKELMIAGDVPKKIKLSEIFAEYKKYVEKEVDASDVEIDYDYEYPSRPVHVEMEVEVEDKRFSWGSDQAKITFTCQEEEDAGFEVELSKYDNYPWRIRSDIDTSIRSLRYLNGFKIYLLKLIQADTEIEIDTHGEDDVVAIRAEN